MRIKSERGMDIRDGFPRGMIAEYFFRHAGMIKSPVCNNADNDIKFQSLPFPRQPVAACGLPVAREP